MGINDVFEGRSVTLMQLPSGAAPQVPLYKIAVSNLEDGDYCVPNFTGHDKTTGNVLFDVSDSGGINLNEPTTIHLDDDTETALLVTNTANNATLTDNVDRTTLGTPALVTSSATFNYLGATLDRQCNGPSF